MSVEALTVDAVRLQDGRTVTLGAAKSLEIGGSLSSPAWSMSGVFPVEALPGELGQVTVWQGSRTLFTGKVDCQRAAVSVQGRLFSLDARSKGALLLDNEATPCILTNVRLRTVFGLFCEPYGFVCYNPQPSRVLSMYTVRAGLSEWEALTGYTRRVFGITPYVEGEQVRICRPGSASPVRISNTGKGLRFSRLEHVRTPYNMISDVMMRDTDGSYSASVHNSSAAYFGVRRKRYVIPQNEFVDALSLDANQRIRRSMLDAEQVQVTLVGMADLMPGQEVEIVDEALTVHNLLVGEMCWQLGETGLVTKLWLISSVYYALLA